MTDQREVTKFQIRSKGKGDRSEYRKCRSREGRKRTPGQQRQGRKMSKGTKAKNEEETETKKEGK